MGVGAERGNSGWQSPTLGRGLWSLTPPWEKTFFFRGDGRRGRAGNSGWQSPTLGRGLWTLTPPWEKNFFFRGDGSRGRAGQLRLAVSHPWPGPLAPDSRSTLMEDFNSTQKNFHLPHKGRRGRRSAGSLPPSLCSVSPHREGGRVHPHGGLWLSLFVTTNGCNLSPTDFFMNRNQFDEKMLNVTTLELSV